MSFESQVLALLTASVVRPFAPQGCGCLGDASFVKECGIRLPGMRFGRRF